ncbi:hypothetical protein V8F33_003086 [Rhypophila sp. PSN 637]
MASQGACVWCVQSVLIPPCTLIFAVRALLFDQARGRWSMFHSQPRPIWEKATAGAEKSHRVQMSMAEDVGNPQRLGIRLHQFRYATVVASIFQQTTSSTAGARGRMVMAGEHHDIRPAACICAPLQSLHSVYSIPGLRKSGVFFLTHCSTGRISGSRHLSG